MISNCSAIENTHFLDGVNKAGHTLDVTSLRRTRHRLQQTQGFKQEHCLLHELRSWYNPKFCWMTAAIRINRFFIKQRDWWVQSWLIREFPLQQRHLVSTATRTAPINWLALLANISDCYNYFRISHILFLYFILKIITCLQKHTSHFSMGGKKSRNPK